MTSRFRTRHALVLSLFVFGLVASASAAPAQTLKGLWYEDKTKGFRFRIPKDYVQVPLREDERWTVALFQSKKEYAGSVRDGDSGWPHKPTIKVILFDDAAIADSRDIDLGGIGGTIKISRPYRDYRDYVKSNLPGGGYFFETEKEGKSGKIEVTEYEIKVEKLARDRMRYLAWVFHGDGYDFAVEIDLLEAQYRKLRNPIISSFKSFKFIEREGVTEVADANANADDGEDTPWAEMTVKQRMDWRMAQEDQREARLRAKLPEDWDVIKTDDLLIMSHAGRSFTNQVRRMAEASRKYMEDRFGELSDEYVRRTVIRICRNFDEYAAYVLGGSADSWLIFAFGDGEITAMPELSSVFGFQMIFEGVAWHYIGEKLRSTWDIPYWLRTAMDGYFAGAHFRNRRVIFEDVSAERQAFVKLLKDRENREMIMTPQQLTQLIAEDVSDGWEKEHELRWQFLSLLRFFEGPGQKHKLLKDRDFLIEYIKLVDATTAEFEKDNPITVAPIKQAKTEAEEERQKQLREQRGRDYADQAEKRERELLALVAEKAFDWTVEDWEDLAKAYERYWRTRK